VIVAAPAVAEGAAPRARTAMSEAKAAAIRTGTRATVARKRSREPPGESGSAP
jgi:hypothetical protein